MIRERGRRQAHSRVTACCSHAEACVLLRLFCARGRNAIAKRALLLLLPSGDWSSRRPEMYVPANSQMTAAEAERIMSNGLVTALAGSSFELYPRHRWCGADLAIDRCGILEAVHELGSGAYTHYLALLGHRQSKQTPDAPSVLLPLLALPSGVQEVEGDIAVQEQRGADMDASVQRALNE